MGEGLGAHLFLQINIDGGKRAFEPPEGRRKYFFYPE